MLEAGKKYYIGLKSSFTYRGTSYSDLGDVTLLEDKDDQYIFSIKSGKFIIELPVMKDMIASYYELLPLKAYWYKEHENVYETVMLTANEAKINKKAGIKLLSYDAMLKEATASSNAGNKVVYTLETPYVYMNGTKPVRLYHAQLLNGKQSYIN